MWHTVDLSGMPKKEDFKSLCTGWMSPDGSFFPTEYMEHLGVADEIWKEYFRETPPNDVEQQLLKKQFVCIRCVTFMEHGFLFDFDRHLTQDQITAIKPVVEDSWDRLIASSRNDLEDEFSMT